MKYILELTDKDPVNNMTIHCKDSKEAIECKKKAQKMGFEVRVKGERHDDKRTPEKYSG